MQDDFRRALDEIKLRAPVEDVVREYVPDLRKQGNLWVACCPFHEERTPSFKVNPQRGTWHCFGACSEGGDQISFVERMRGVEFLEAVEILAARSGVELPERRARRSRPRADEGLIQALERATHFYEEALDSPSGAAARAYLEERGLSAETARSFRLGWAPAGYDTLVQAARKSGVAFELLERAGLARRNDRGLAYDFFRGRLVIPIRDLDGRVVGFGARRLSDEDGGPKYVNTPETELFRKSGLVYGLDLALRETRRCGRLVLVEGYTDVMAAHQVGLSIVGAVLGTSTTEQHAALVRRSGAQCVSLVFDGDEAGRKAALKALHGLLPLGLGIEVVPMPAGLDPCDLLIREGAEPFTRRLDEGREWFDFLCEGLEEARGVELSNRVDAVLELLERVPKPVHREDLLRRLAARLGLPVESLREQWRAHPGSRRRPVRDGDVREGDVREGAAAPGEAPAEVGAPVRPVDPHFVRAYAELAAAVLRDDSLLPLVCDRVADCPDADLRRILEVLMELCEGERETNEQSLLTELADHPARTRVVGLFRSAAELEQPRQVLEGALEFLRRKELERENSEVSRRLIELQLALDQSTGAQGPREVDEPRSLSSVRAEIERLRRRHGELRGQARAR